MGATEKGLWIRLWSGLNNSSRHRVHADILSMDNINELAALTSLDAYPNTDRRWDEIWWDLIVGEPEPVVDEDSRVVREERFE